MFEPLLGLLTRGYVESKCDNRPISGWSGSAAMSAREVMGLRSNPCRKWAGLNISPRRSRANVASR